MLFLDSFKEIKTLILKDFILEWRTKYALSGMLLYLVSTVFLCYMSFRLKSNDIDPITWNTLFWIILLFTAVNSITKSFIQERAGRQIYYYQITNPESIIISKIIYNTALMLMLGVLGFGFYAMFMGNHATKIDIFMISILLGSVGFSFSLTLISAIASKADNAAGIMAVLSFPIILPMLMMLIKLSKNAMDGLEWSSCSDEILVLSGIDLIVGVLSYILFPYIWRS